VIESRGERGTPQVVERWGDPVSSKCVLAASFDDRKKDPVCVAVPFFLSLLLF
jgi:ribosome biogenesis protein NSA1